MEQILKGVTDYNVQVHDCNEPGHYFSHPNIFSVQLEGETEVELGEVKSKVDKLKQSHTVYLLSVILMLIECTESFEQRVTYHSDFSWWKYSLDGSFALDGSINLNHWYPTEFRPVYPFDTVLTENFIADRIFHRIPDVYHENIFKPSSYEVILYGGKVFLMETFHWTERESLILGIRWKLLSGIGCLSAIRRLLKRNSVFHCLI